MLEKDKHYAQVVLQPFLIAIQSKKEDQNYVHDFVMA